MRVNRFWHGAVIAHLARATSKRDFDMVFGLLASSGLLARVHKAFNVHGLLVRDVEHHREFVIWFMAAHLLLRLDAACSAASAAVVGARGVMEAEKAEYEQYQRRNKLFWQTGEILRGGYGLVASMHEKLELQDTADAKRQLIRNAQTQIQQAAKQRDKAKRTLAIAERDLRVISKRLKSE